MNARRSGIELSLIHISVLDEEGANLGEVGGETLVGNGGVVDTNLGKIGIDGGVEDQGVMEDELGVQAGVTLEVLVFEVGIDGIDGVELAEIAGKSVGLELEEMCIRDRPTIRSAHYILCVPIFSFAVQDAPLQNCCEFSARVRSVSVRERALEVVEWLPALPALPAGSQPAALLRSSGRRTLPGAAASQFVKGSAPASVRSNNSST